MRVELLIGSAHTTGVFMQSPQSADVARAIQQAQTAQQQVQAAQQEAAQAAQAAARAAAQAGRDAALEGARAAAEAQRAVAEAQREATRAAIRAQIEAARAAAGRGRAGTPWQFPGPPGPQVPEGAVIISVAFFVMCAVIAIGYPLARAIARRMDRRGAASTAADPDVRNRLERIEQAVDAIAVEVERISEGQRFTTKVIADLRALPQADPAAAVGDRAGERSAVPLSRAREIR